MGLLTDSRGDQKTLRSLKYKRRLNQVSKKLLTHFWKTNNSMSQWKLRDNQRFKSQKNRKLLSYQIFPSRLSTNLFSKGWRALLNNWTWWHDKNSMLWNKSKLKFERKNRNHPFWAQLREICRRQTNKLSNQEEKWRKKQSGNTKLNSPLHHWTWWGLNQAASTLGRSTLPTLASLPGPSLSQFTRHQIKCWKLLRSNR